MTEGLSSIVLPVSGQADHIRAVVEGYEGELKGIGAYEMLLVVNGPAGKTLDAAREIQRGRPAVRVFHTPKRGWGRAVLIGLRNSRGDLLCYTNSARTTAKDLVRALELARANPGSVIKANRKIREGWRRRLGSLLYNLECRALFDLSWWDINGTPKVFPREFDRLMRLERTDDLIDLEFSVICRQEAYPMLELPIFSTRRHGGRSTTDMGSAMKMYTGALRMWRDVRNGTAPERGGP